MSLNFVCERIDLKHSERRSHISSRFAGLTGYLPQICTPFFQIGAEELCDMDWLKQHGFSIVGVLAGGALAAHAGFNLGVESRNGWSTAEQKPALTVAAEPQGLRLCWHYLKPAFSERGPLFEGDLNVEVTICRSRAKVAALTGMADKPRSKKSRVDRIKSLPVV